MSVTCSLRKCGHSIVGEAVTFEEFLERRVQFRESGATVAIVDGNLGPISTHGEDGKMIADWLRANIPEIKVIAWTDGMHRYGDVSVTKGLQEVDMVALCKAVTTL
jgi:hypothetical protein